MAAREALRRIVGLVLWPWRTLNAVVTKTHANWIALILAVATILVTIYFASPGPTRPSSDTEAAGPPTTEVETNLPPVATLNTQSPLIDWGNKREECDVEYALSQRSVFRELIESEVRQCVPSFDNPIELYYSCQVEDGVYTVTLKYQYSGILNDERLPFSAEYRGPKDIDMTEVKVTPLTPVFKRLCREKAEAKRP